MTIFRVLSSANVPTLFGYLAVGIGEPGMSLSDCATTLF